MDEGASSRDWSKEADKIVERASKNSSKAREGHDLLCLMFVHKYQSTSKVILHLKLSMGVCHIDYCLFCQEHPEIDFSDDPFWLENLGVGRLSDAVKRSWNEILIRNSIKNFSERIKKQEANQKKNRRKRISRIQRCKINKEQQTQELTFIVSEICDRVAEECAIFDIAAQQSITGLLDDLCHKVAAETAEENERLPPLIEELLVESLAAEAAAEAVEEASSSARQAVLRQARAGTLPLGFARELAAALLPCLEPLLEPSIDCFVCLAPLDLASTGVRHLACCDGGSFACAGCVASHAGRHPPIAELRIVRHAAAVRRQLGVGEPATARR